MTYCRQHTGTITERKEQERKKTAQKIAVLATNLQVNHQANVFIDPTTGASIEYRHLIERPTEAI